MWKASRLFWFLSLIFAKIFSISASSCTLKRFEMCEKCEMYKCDMYKIQVYINGTMENNNQYLNFEEILKIPIDDTLTAKIAVKLLVIKTFVPVLTFEEKHACSALHKNFGVNAHEVERGIGLIPGLCPIPIGHYRLNHWLFDAKKIPLRGFPFGYLHFQIKVFDKGEIVGCFNFEMDNQNE